LNTKKDSVACLLRRIVIAVLVFAVVLMPFAYAFSPQEVQPASTLSIQTVARALKYDETTSSTEAPINNKQTGNIEDYSKLENISARLIVDSVDVYEPDDSFVQARVISVLTGVSSEDHTIEPAGDNDYFRFDVDASSFGVYSFYTLGSTDTYGYLYNSTYNQLASNDDGNGYPNFKISFNIKVSGTYYLRVCGFNQSTTIGPYTINYYYAPSASTFKMVYEHHVVNGLNASQLVTDPIPSNWGYEVVTGRPGTGWTFYWGVRVWVRSSSGVESELTSGEPVAVGTRNGGTRFMVVSATWNCPGAELNLTDSIVVRVYSTQGDGPWRSVGNFTTAQLGATQLDSATWTICYDTEWYTQYSYPNGWWSYGGFRWAYYWNSRIENFLITASAPSCEIWTDKATYTVGETMKVYVQVRNTGPTTPVRATIKLGLPNGNQYGPLLNMVATVPANFDSGSYLWQSFTIPSVPKGTYSWIMELRNPATNALIDSDVYTWTLA
jgi:hypothetical protein